MRKLSLLFVVIALSVSCDPPANAWSWYVKNSVEQTLTFKYLEYRYSADDSSYHSRYRSVTIPHGDSIRIYRTDFVKLNSLPFNYCFEKSTDLFGEDAYWQILSEDDVELKTWNYSDKGLPGQRFFEESSWYHNKKPGYHPIVTEFSWIFNILSEDIQPAVQ